MTEFPPVIFIDLYRTPKRPFIGRQQRWRWRAVSEGNRRALASGESYYNRADAIAAIELLFGARSTVFIREREHGNRELRRADGGLLMRAEAPTGKSIELRLGVDGDCHCATPVGPGDWPPTTCHHYIECQWGKVEITDPRPDRGSVGPLMLIPRDYFGQLFKSGPQRHHGAIHSADAIPQEHPVTADTPLRLYAYIDYRGQHWAWELFEAHWWDGVGCSLYLGRWPD